MDGGRMKPERGLLRVVGWERFQHYRDRLPPWIKLHRDLLDDEAWFDLPAAQRGYLVSIWILAARTMEGTVSDRPEFLAARIGATAEDPLDLDLLIRLGWLERIASSALAGRKHGASAPQVPEKTLEQSASNPLALARSREAEAEESQRRGDAREPPLSAGAVGRIDALLDVAARRREFYCGGADTILDIDGHRSLVERDNRAELEALARSHPAEFMRHSAAFVAGGAKVEKLGKARGRCFGLLRHLCYDDTGEAEGPGEGETELRRAALEKLRAMPHKTSAEIFG